MATFILASVIYITAANQSLAVPIVVGILFEVAHQSFHMSCETILQCVDPNVGARFNSIYGAAAWLGGVAGNEGGSLLLLRHGFRAEGALFLSALGLLVCIMAVRGPYEDRRT